MMNSQHIFNNGHLQVFLSFTELFLYSDAFANGFHLQKNSWKGF